MTSDLFTKRPNKKDEKTHALLVDVTGRISCLTFSNSGN